MRTWFEAPGAATVPRTDPSAVTIGMFDGVHRGHQEVLARTREASHGTPTVAVTFEPHPMAVLRPELVPPRLTSLSRRVELLHEHGADEVRVLSFSREMAALEPDDFVERVLVQELKARHVVVGHNFRYGARAQGDPSRMRGSGVHHGFSVVDLELQSVAGHECSSTRVRELVAQAQLEQAAVMLGRPHAVEGVVVQGDRRGRDLGFPTANVPVDEQAAVPPDGVYAGRLVTASQTLPAAVSVGSNPTFRGTERRVESYVIDHGHDLELYGESVRVELLERVRPMVAFDSVDALVAQMHEDVCAAREVLGR
ncbi:bifunctional riboflavin kinase/FAD synthetase [Aeromicrobium sp. CF4.19]|uniref:bifunctional riboflavin kinase/FAD synthetase n=1 Tax=Aeromicrobium sp. CF4.19 TaxID=3373082 RepID=UPI003EE6B10B